MTVLISDGVTVAMDRRASSRAGSRVTRKLTKHGDVLVGYAGDAPHGEALKVWFLAGADPEKAPKPADPNDWAHLYVMQAGKLLTFENGPYPLEFEYPVHAGSGGQYARGALEAGASVIEAAFIACRQDVFCGDGIDWFNMVTGDGGFISKEKI